MRLNLEIEQPGFRDSTLTGLTIPVRIRVFRAYRGVEMVKRGKGGYSRLGYVCGSPAGGFCFPPSVFQFREGRWKSHGLSPDSRIKIGFKEGERR